MSNEPERPQRVVVTNLDISFGNLVGLLLKVALAAIPAAIILGVVASLAFAVLAGLIR